MTSTNAVIDGSASPTGEAWTTRALIARHKRMSLSALAIVVVMVALLVAGIAGSNAGAVSDTSTCSAWSSANQGQQQAYAGLYIREHGALPGGGTSAASVAAAINKGCMQAFGSDAADLVNVYQAINRQY
ncbi:MAG: hypothetical protein QOG59_3562 [Solirubrobacteraceae bacterium]|jgi:hypothetical protein|nr:hypothetical protein [Solirubrobacteraceae bacterium]